MKQNYLQIRKGIANILLLLLTVINLQAQDLHFTFANAQITNDGMDNYYDVDVMIQSTVDFKLGSGQLYLTYNTAAFGENISAAGSVEYTQPSGSILGEVYTFAAYKDFIQNDNTTSRVSLAFQQGIGSGTITANNVTGTPKLLLHVRIRFTDVGQDPMIAFETGVVYLDQFYTACGPTAGGLADCAGEPGVQLINDTFDSSNSADTAAPVITLTGDDPQEIAQGNTYNELGATTDDGSDIVIDDSTLDINTIGSYSVTYNATDIVGNVAIEVTRMVNVVPLLSTADHIFGTVSLYPNPATNEFIVSGLKEKVTIEIFNIEGKRIKQVKGYRSEQIDISSMKSGVYFVKLIEGTTLKNLRLVKN
ncbi:T9SS type A sorting domain-containing protein [Aquimarina sp. 2201CG5-10]|uniref:T9SS type A sorting domain-containing protein n=1 Tax=Aquimarina callyspongiae TaxID=3098150 RepID=UPI002AB34190|nr:T9SS type A sorting domain-containing protein [Aquimarina sp. 2201CG5-10]MDY8137945.1 T9SS type A sorting domain-containing protein [Aquimarina sp. 2201CG5-10]